MQLFSSNLFFFSKRQSYNIIYIIFNQNKIEHPSSIKKFQIYGGSYIPWFTSFFILILLGNPASFSLFFFQRQSHEQYLRAPFSFLSKGIFVARAGYRGAWHETRDGARHLYEGRTEEVEKKREIVCTPGMGSSPPRAWQGGKRREEWDRERPSEEGELCGTRVRASGTKRARDKREGTDKRKRGHSGVTLPRVLLRLSFTSGNRYADLGLSPRARVRKCSLSLSVCPLRLYERTRARSRSSTATPHAHAHART